MTPTVLAITGASGSGKTRLSTRLRQLLDETVAIAHICEDAYYRDQSDLPMSERLQTNYDHPDSLEHELLIEHLKALREGQAIEIPRYDYHQHNRLGETESVEPAPLVILEGTLLLSRAELREQIDCAIFLDASLELCLQRRIRRDAIERGRTEASVVSQFEATVRPMYFEFIEPGKDHAHLHVDSDWSDEEALVAIAQHLSESGHNALASALMRKTKLPRVS